MNKYMLPGIGLAVGLLVGTGWTVVSYDPPVDVAADSAHAEEPGDSAAHDAGPDAGHDAAPASDDHGGGEDSAGHGTEPDAGGESWQRPAPRPASAAGHAGHADEADAAAGLAQDGEAEDVELADTDGASQLARIFAAMQPKDAARVLSQLNDREIERVLVRMGPRQAAAVLSNLEPDRAAVLSRSVLGGAVSP